MTQGTSHEADLGGDFLAVVVGNDTDQTLEGPDTEEADLTEFPISELGIDLGNEVLA